MRWRAPFPSCPATGRKRCASSGAISGAADCRRSSRDPSNEQEPNPDSRVTLAPTMDVFGQRQANVHWSLTERDKYAMRVTAEVFDSELRRLGMGKVELAPCLASDRGGWPPDMVGGHHHMGTTRMASDPKRGVVDAHCR